MDLLGLFAFRTAVPFGYLAFLGGTLAVAFVGLRLLRGGAGVRPVGSIRVWGGVAILALLAFSFVATFAYEGALEMNPWITTDSVAGEWRDHGARLSLHPGGTYRCEGHGACDRLGAEGRWRLVETFSLAFERADGQ